MTEGLSASRSLKSERASITPFASLSLEDDHTTHPPSMGEGLWTEIGVTLATPRTVAALFVITNGGYYGYPGVDPWDEKRDARLYDGSHPVVAHPPCARWSRLAGFTEHRFGLKRGDDGGCFEAALTWGGVLEHPAYSKAWDQFDLPKPQHRSGWTRSLLDEGASCYVEQGRYGAPVKKATWLYAYGIELPELRWGYVADCDVRDGSGGGTNKGMWRSYRQGSVTSGTPAEFRDALVAMARTAREVTA